MVKHFRSRAVAETSLFMHGYRRTQRDGVWNKRGVFVATIHPVAGSMTVRVAYVPSKGDA